MANEKSFFQRRKKILIAAVVVLVLALIVIMNLSSQREKTVKVAIEKVAAHDLASVISASGEIKPKKNVNISAQVPGRIVKIGVVEGDEVKAGDFLLQLDSTQYEANAERDRAFIQSTKAELIQAEARMRRDATFSAAQKRLFDEGLISQDQMETARVQAETSSAQFKSIQFQIQQAEASLKSTLDSLSKTVYVSPLDGVVTSLRVEEGEIALIGTMNNPGTVLMTLADLSVMEVEVEVDETDVVGLELGQPASVKVDAFPEAAFQGKVTEVGSSAIQRSTVTATTQEAKDFKVTITLDDPARKLKPGLSASADITTAEKKAVLAVPIAALVLREKESAGAAAAAASSKAKAEEEGVYLVEAGRAKFVPVRKGITGEMLVEVAEGLKEGQEIVTGPYSALRLLKDGTLVKAEEKAAPAPEAK
jgi:HlyD family secretion protein